MIAKNFVKYPEALRFQREMFSNGYHNSPRIMRLVECIFNWTPAAPEWWKEAKGRARDLAQRVRKSISDFFKDSNVKRLEMSFTGEVKDLPAGQRPTWNTITVMLMNNVEKIKHSSGDYVPTPDLDPYWNSVSHSWALQAQGEYRWFCPKTRSSRLWVSYPADEI